MTSESVAQTIRRYLAALRENGVPARRAILFGSCVRNEQREWSDIDVLIEADEYDADGPAWNRRLWEIAARVDSRIEPIPVGSREWLEDDGAPLLEMARREGVLFEA